MRNIDSLTYTKPPTVPHTRSTFREQLSAWLERHWCAPEHLLSQRIEIGDYVRAHGMGIKL